jgi:sulfate adenylyltransferase subunit 2
MREVVAEFSRPVMLYSIGKDSSVMLRLAQKAFYPIKPPFPLLHIDTSYKFQEMIEFRDRVAADLGFRLIVHSAEKSLAEGANPFKLGTQKCCAALKTGALLEALALGGFDAAMGGARRDEEKSRAKERVYSFRDDRGQWDPKNQRPELWNIYNGRINKGESIRVFPLSNWTELDIWEYIRAENIPVVPLYFAREQLMLVRGESLVSPEHELPMGPEEKLVPIVSRMRSLGCTYCTGAVRSTATNVSEIIDELRLAKKSERENRVIDHDQEGSMEQKKREGYF